MVLLSPPRAQASIELMIILPLLVIILTLSVGIFGTQLANLRSLESQHAAQRTAELIAESVEELVHSPAGTTLRVFIPPATASQSITIGSGLVQVQSGSAYGSARITNTSVSASSLYDGNMLYLAKDGNGTLSVSEGS